MQKLLVAVPHPVAGSLIHLENPGIGVVDVDGISCAIEELPEFRLCHLQRFFQPLAALVVHVEDQQPRRHEQGEDRRCPESRLVDGIEGDRPVDDQGIVGELVGVYLELVQQRIVKHRPGQVSRDNRYPVHRLSGYDPDGNLGSLFTLDPSPQHAPANNTATELGSMNGIDRDRTGRGDNTGNFGLRKEAPSLLHRVGKHQYQRIRRQRTQLPYRAFYLQFFKETKLYVGEPRCFPDQLAPHGQPGIGTIVNHDHLTGSRVQVKGHRQRPRRVMELGYPRHLVPA